jgi:hypothetical protein
MCPPGCKQPEQYRIRIQGHLAPHWAGWFEGLAVLPQGDDETLLVGPVADQSALHGLLAKIRDLNLPLLGVERVLPNEDT